MNKYSQKSTAGKVYKTILNHSLMSKGDRVIVALSGGPDSTALLHILLSLSERLAIEVSACHFNHKLRGQASDDDELFVRKLCLELGIELFCGSAEKVNQYKSEDSAREARYHFFEKILQEGMGDRIAIAHNQNDQAETVLMRLVRGTGIRGLKAIPYRRKNFIRPLLDISRNEIEEYLALGRFPFVIDKTNFSSDYQRNKIRAELIPYLSKLNPQILKELSNLSKSASLDYGYIEEKALHELAEITLKYESKGYTLDYKKYLLLHPALRAMVLRLAFEKLDSIDNISSIHIDEVVSVLEKGTGKKQKRLPHSLLITLTDGKITIKK